MLKSIVLGLSASLLLTACAGTQEKISSTDAAKAHSEIASDATAAEIKQHEKYVEHLAHVKQAKKRNKRVNITKKPVDLEKFCFQDNLSIHYRAEERCK